MSTGRVSYLFGDVRNCDDSYTSRKKSGTSLFSIPPSCREETELNALVAYNCAPGYERSSLAEWEKGCKLSERAVLSRESSLIHVNLPSVAAIFRLLVDPTFRTRKCVKALRGLTLKVRTRFDCSTKVISLVRVL